jgi:hypothetical protein
LLLLLIAFIGSHNCLIVYCYYFFLFLLSLWISLLYKAEIVAFPLRSFLNCPCRCCLQLSFVCNETDGIKTTKQVACLFLAWFILRHWRWRRHVPLRRWLIFNGLHDVILPKMEVCKLVTDLTVTSYIKLYSLSVTANDKTPERCAGYSLATRIQNVKIFTFYKLIIQWTITNSMLQRHFEMLRLLHFNKKLFAFVESKDSLPCL